MGGKCHMVRSCGGVVTGWEGLQGGLWVYHPLHSSLPPVGPRLQFLDLRSPTNRRSHSGNLSRRVEVLHMGNNGLEGYYAKKCLFFFKFAQELLKNCEG